MQQKGTREVTWLNELVAIATVLNIRNKAKNIYNEKIIG